MSERLHTPVSTLFETLKEIEKVFCFTIVLEDNVRDVPLGETIPVESTYQPIEHMETENAKPLKLQAN